MSSSTRLRSLAAAIRHLPATSRELVTLGRDHRTLVEQVRRTESQLNDLSQRTHHVENLVKGVSESVDRLHATLVEADPRQALDIVTAVRDDVRSLLVEVAEQANLARDRAIDAAAQG